MTVLYPHVLWLIIPLAVLLWKWSQKLADSVHIIVLLLLVVALSRPVQEQALQKADIKAKDIIIALDVSYSMKASDLNPSRYDFAKETISALIKANPSDNIMLLAFTTNPLLLSPPTTDHALINVALKSLNPEFILTKGTSLETLFKKLASMHKEHKNLILMTDGGDENDLVPLSQSIKKTGMKVTILALGTTQGTTIKNKDGSLLKDTEGNLVISRINPLLEHLATSADGTYMTALSTAQATAGKLNSVLQNNENDAQHIQKMQRHHLERYQIPLTLALLLFFMLHTRAAKVLVLFFAFFGFQVHASLFDTYHLNSAYTSYKNHDLNTTLAHLRKVEDPSLQSQMTLANTYYRQGLYKKAIRIYQSIRSTSANIKQQIYYNIANAYVQMGAYGKAKIYYTKTLQLGEDADARYNLKIIVLLTDKVSADLGIAHPKSQNSDTSKSKSQETDKDDTKSEDQPSSGSGSGGENKKNEKEEKNKLLSGEKEEQQPLGSKVYELINKGYIRETQPW